MTFLPCDRTGCSQEATTQFLLSCDEASTTIEILACPADEAEAREMLEEARSNWEEPLWHLKETWLPDELEDLPF